MERQAGLGRSLEDVLESLTPAEAEAPPASSAQFEPEAVEERLDQLIDDIGDLRDRVEHLVGLAPEQGEKKKASRSKHGKKKNAEKSKRHKSGKKGKKKPRA